MLDDSIEPERISEIEKRSGLVERRSRSGFRVRQLNPHSQ